MAGGRGFKYTVIGGVAIAIALGVFFAVYYSNLEPEYVPPPVAPTTPSSTTPGGPAVSGRDLSPEEQAKIDAVMKITKTEWATFRLLSGGPADPVWNSLSEQLRLIIKGKVEGIEGIKGAGVDSMPGTGVINVNKITEDVREAECGFTFSFLAKAAMKGMEPFKEKRTSIEGVANLYEQGLHFIVSSDARIDSIADIKGKSIKLATGPMPEIDEMLTRWVLSEYGLSYNDFASVEHSYLDLGLMHLQEGSVDAVSYFISVGNKELKQFLKENTDFKILSVKSDVISSLESKKDLSNVISSVPVESETSTVRIKEIKSKSASNPDTVIPVVVYSTSNEFPSIFTEIVSA